MKMRMISLVLAALSILPSAAATINFDKWLEVTNGMRTNQLIELMGSAPSRTTESQASEAELWIWEKEPHTLTGNKLERDPAKTASSVSFAVSHGRVVQRPEPEETTPAEREAHFWRRTNELRAIVERMQEKGEEAERRQKRIAEFAKTHPELSDDIRERWEAGEISEMQAFTACFKAREAKHAELVSAYLKQSNLTPEIRSALKEGKVAVGMTKDEVKLAAYGEPDEDITSGDANGETSVWTFTGQSLEVTFRNGLVVSWKQTFGRRKR